MQWLIKQNLIVGDITQKGYEKKKAKLLSPYLNCATTGSIFYNKKLNTNSWYYKSIVLQKFFSTR